MFEECFSMIELNGLLEAQEPGLGELEADPDLETLQSVLISALDEALSKLDDEFSTVH